MPSYICARCAAQYPTCCRMKPEDAAVCFPLSEAEAARLAPYAAEMGIEAGLPMQNSKDFIRVMRLLFPDRQRLVRQRYPAGGEHLVLPTSKSGQCLFLGQEGCKLPREARPRYCRLFPIWFREGHMELFAAHQCLVSREAPSPGPALKALGMSLDQAQRLYDELCAEWGLQKE